MALEFPDSPTEGQQVVFSKFIATFSNGAWTMTPRGTALPFNYLVNPAFQIAQQTPHATVITTNVLYVADQWNWSITGAGDSYRVDRGAPNYTRAISGSAVATGPGTHFYLAQSIEGSRIAFLRWSAAGGCPIVLRFKVRASGVTFPFRVAVSVRTYASPYFSYCESFPLTQANVWHEFTMTVPAPSVGAWPVDNTMAMRVFFSIAPATDFIAPSKSAWNSGNYVCTSDQSSAYQAAGATIDFAEVGIYADPNSTGRAPPFEVQGEREVMQDCQRYWYRLLHGRGVVVAATTAARTGTRHPVNMRTAPAMAVIGAPVLYEQSVSPAITSVAVYTSAHVAELDVTAAGGGMTPYRGVIITTSNATNYIAVSAR